MINHEINQFLAEKLFGLVKGKDFGEPTEFCCKEQEEHFYTYGHIAFKGRGSSFGNQCTECGAALNEDILLLQPLTDYIEEYLPVLEEIIELLADKGRIDQFIIKDVVYVEIAAFTRLDKPFIRISKTGDTIGEAVCRAAVAYLQEVGND